MQTEQFETVGAIADINICDVETVEQTQYDRISNLLKYPIIHNTKHPAIEAWTTPENCRRSAIHGNYGVLTGPANNLIVVDVDQKDNGIE